MKAVRLAKGVALGLAWATALSVAAALGGRDSKAGAVRAARRARRAFRDRRTARSGVTAGNWKLHPGEGGVVGLSLHPGAQHGPAQRELDGLVSAIRERGAR